MSDDCGLIVDAPLPAGADLREIDRTLKGMDGVVGHRMFLDMAPSAVVDGASGVRVIEGA